MDPARVKESIEQLGIGFMFAPSFHPAMRRVAPVRKELGVRTVFNLMGPLINPARVDAQLVGVYSSGVVGQVAKVLGKLGLQEALVVHGLEGVDEISVTGKTLLSHLRNGQTETREYLPRDFGVGHGQLRPLTSPANADEGAALVLSALSGDLEERDSCLWMVLVNAAACLVLAEKAESFPEGVELAKASIKTGGAMKKLEQTVRFSGGSIDEARERYAKK
jgi:anthranilate phosphoribosyltransferase